MRTRTKPGVAVQSRGAAWGGPLGAARLAGAALGVLVSLAIGARAAAQTAPAGNNHPKTPEITETTGANPFGEPTDTVFDAGAKRATPDETARKHAFADAVDLSPLRDLAVFHRGRVMILDTLARETVSEIVGRKTYTDAVGADLNGRRVSYDPLFTLLDIMIDPGYYADRPLIRVEYPPLREAMLEKVFSDTTQREAWKRLGRMRPRDLARVAGPVAKDHELDPLFQRGLNGVQEEIGLYLGSWHNLLMIAPESESVEWHHVSALRPGTVGAEAVRNLAQAWRAGDAPKASAAAAALASALPKINSAMYPGSRRDLELAYNTVDPFEWGYRLYCLAFITLLLAFGTGRRWLVGIGVSTLLIALAMHAGGFAGRCIIAERFAIQNQFESMTGLSLFAATVGTTVMAVRRQWLFGAAAAGVGFMVLVAATQTAIPGVEIGREAPILNTSVLLKYHVTTVLVSYGLISLGFIVSLFYLGTYYAAILRGRAGGSVSVGGLAVGGAGGPAGFVEVSAGALGLDEDAPKGTQRVLADLDTAQMIVLQLAFWGLGTGVLLGAWWADHSWGRWWAFDPKELWALLTWVVYLVVIHLRFTTGKYRALITAWLSVLGFFVMLWTYFGVNLLLPGLHAYA